MKQNLYHNFLAVVPGEEHIIQNCPEISPYIYKFIVSSPCRQLIKDIEAYASQTTIYGILTRGSLAQYLFASGINIPIFQLEYSLCGILNQLKSCRDEGFKRIVLVEVSPLAEGKDCQDQKTELDLGDTYYIYYKIYHTENLRETMLTLKEKSIDFMIGDVEPCALAQEFSIPHKVFKIDNDCYQTAITKALLATSASIMEKSKNAFIEDLTNLVFEAIIIADNQGEILKYNQTGEKLFFHEKNCTNLSELFEMDMEKIIALPSNQMVMLQGKNYIVNLIPVILDDVQQYAAIINNVNDIENMEMSIRVQNKQRGLTAKTRFEDMIYQDEKMAVIVERAKKYAKSSATIMICGATGTGKEVMASSIHNASLRANGPFVAINCATFTESLIESELFGYEKGAFTGALPSGKKGLFELAHKGTIFLDEVAELPLSLQAKLLRVLQEKEIRRIGGEKMIPVDVRVIVATNKTLCRLVENGGFREDLYYRLCVLDLVIPSLKERPKDIIPLFKHFLQESALNEKHSLYWTDDAIFNELLYYDWPGNVRELRNFAERIVLLAQNYRLTKEFIHSMMALKYETGPKKSPVHPAAVPTDLKDAQAQYISRPLEQFHHHKDKVCQYLGISRTTLWRKLKAAASSQDRQ